MQGMLFPFNLWKCKLPVRVNYKSISDPTQINVPHSSPNFYNSNKKTLGLSNSLCMNNDCQHESNTEMKQTGPVTCLR